ncbi:hypothetical protein FOZ63_004835 [Perkinsus olseni]|uniref:PPM-type phosphatase domain-containing protein n=2 Tax=Perkinsus olseni TaxID=32597 RepID=A0A7J6T900_PEROL|nr:hypothetical protein FOZ63_004835 [Perkinsus olseni]
MVASDGLWDIISPKTMEDKIRSLGPSPTPTQVDHLIKSSCIPNAPHDDTTWVLLRIPIQTSTAVAAGKDDNDNNEEDGEDPFDTSAVRQHWTSHSSPINRPATLSTLDALFTPQDGDEDEDEQQFLAGSQTDRGRSISSPDGFRRGGRGRKHHLPPPSTLPAASSLDQLFAPLGERLSSTSVAPPPPAATQQRSSSRWGRLKHLRDPRHH